MKKIWEAESFAEAATLYVWGDDTRTHAAGFVQADGPGAWIGYEVVGSPHDENRGLREVGRFTTMQEAQAAVEAVIPVS